MNPAENPLRVSDNIRASVLRFSAKSFSFNSANIYSVNRSTEEEKGEIILILVIKRIKGEGSNSNGLKGDFIGGNHGKQTKGKISS